MTGGRRGGLRSRERRDGGRTGAGAVRAYAGGGGVGGGFGAGRGGRRGETAVRGRAPGAGRTENERESRVPPPPPAGSISHLPGAHNTRSRPLLSIRSILIYARTSSAAFGTPAERARQISDRSGVSAVFEQSHEAAAAAAGRTAVVLPCPPPFHTRREFSAKIRRRILSGTCPSL